MSGDSLFLFSTHMTLRKEIAIAAVVVVAIVGVAFWFMRRRRTRA
jgi:hypothetical protein